MVILVYEGDTNTHFKEELYMTINYANFRHFGTDHALIRCHERIAENELKLILNKLLKVPIYIISAKGIVGEHFYIINFLNNCILENLMWKTIEVCI
jgi:hypothetical protein